jgi:hypothetical protein
MSDSPGADIADIGSRLELFVDDWLIERLSGGAELQLHHPIPREVALLTDRPWEGNMCGYITAFRDGDRCRLYYHTGHFDPASTQPPPSDLAVACAESSDGIHWTRPDLGLYTAKGAPAPNLVWPGQGPEQRGVHGFAPFKDANPGAAPEARYKAVGADRDCAGGLFAMQSPDGLHWRMLQDAPVMTGCHFDSQNLAFWDGERREYRAYVRDFQDGRRGIRTCVSPDFIHWSPPEWLEYQAAPAGGAAPAEQLYTNQVLPYPRAPHLFVGFPTRYVEREWSPAIEALPELDHRRLRAGLHPRYGAALTDGLFMTSRDGRSFRRWPEAFLRPGLSRRGNWAYGDNYQCWGLLETRSDLDGETPELSLIASENYWRGASTIFRRHTLRLDGFVSVQAPLAGGEILTRPLRFDGDRLLLNVSASAAGCARVEIQDAEGRPLDGFALGDCREALGDDLAREVAWRGGPDVSAMRGRPVRLRIALRDADLYALRFAPSGNP